MPTTMNLIGQISLAAPSATMSFSSIPGTYTDLVVVLSQRNDNSGSTAQNTRLNMSINGVGTNRSWLRLGTFSGTSVYSDSGTDEIAAMSPGAQVTASTFSNTEIYFPNYAGSTSKSFFTSDVTENNSATNNSITLIAGLWSSTAAITELTFSPGSGNFAANSTAYLYGITRLGAAVGASVQATGGDEIVSGGYKYHVFKSSGYFNVEEDGTVEALLVAGGGGGGTCGTDQAYGAACGAGAGGVRVMSFNIAKGPTLVIVGAGGTRGPAIFEDGRPGNDSWVGQYSSATGGGFGGTGYSPGGDGGSGGAYLRTDIPTGRGIAGQGFDGGLSGVGYAGSGGGGAGQIGQPAPSSFTAGNGGNGTNSFAAAWLTPTSTGISGYIGGGGGGGASPYYGTPVRATGGLGGGGAGCMGGSSATVAENGVANTGGGGGGGGATANVVTTRFGGNGGSGLVIIRYPI